MGKHVFGVGMRVKATHALIEADYHKGDRTLAEKGAEGEVIRISRGYDGRPTYVVRFGRWATDVFCDDYDIEPATELDRFVSETFSPDHDS